MSTYGWTRSSACAAGDCLEASWADGDVLVWDSKLSDQSPVQRWSPNEWQELLRAIRVAENPVAVSHVAFGPIFGGTVVVKFGLPHHEKLVFGSDEWLAFFNGARNNEFLPEVLAARAAAMKDQPEGQPAEATDGSPVAAGVDAATPAPAPNSPAGRLSDQPSSGGAERADQPGPVEDGAER